MSFEIYLQGFRNGDAADTGGAEMRRVVEPYIVERHPDRVVVECGGDTVDLCMNDQSAMASRPTPGVFQLLYEAAAAADWVAIPVGCPTCLTSEDQRQHLPEVLAEDAVLVRSGQEMNDVIENS